MVSLVLREQDSEYARDKDAVKGARASDRRDWSAQSLDLTEIQEIGADQGPQTAGDIGQGRRDVAIPMP